MIHEPRHHPLVRQTLFANPREVAEPLLDVLGAELGVAQVRHRRARRTHVEQRYRRAADAAQVVRRHRRLGRYEAIEIDDVAHVTMFHVAPNSRKARTPIGDAGSGGATMRTPGAEAGARARFTIVATIAMRASARRWRNRSVSSATTGSGNVTSSVPARAGSRSSSLSARSSRARRSSASAAFPPVPATPYFSMSRRI